jgi:hypothetical protein
MTQQATSNQEGQTTRLHGNCTTAGRKMEGVNIMYDTIITTDFSEFGLRERKLAAKLLMASCEQGFPEDFEDDGVQIMMNKNSGLVFFTNSEYQVCMMNGDKLESYYNTPYEGREGFADELRKDYERDPDAWAQEDVEFLEDIGII